MENTIQDFIIGQIANSESEQAARLAFAIRKAIKEFKEAGNEYQNAFSVDAQYEDGDFTAECTFSEDSSMTVMYGEGDDNEMVASLFALKNDKELSRLAGLMLSEGWVAGFNG